MKRSLILLLLLVPVLGICQDKRLALVIGNSEYKYGGSLKNPVNDANLMASTLEGLGFEVIKKINVKKQELDLAILDFWRKQAKYNVSLFYYAGHGVQVDGVNYILPVDVKLEDQLSLKIEAVDVGEVVSQFGRFPNNINLVILDACRDDPFRSWVRGESAGFAAMPAPSGTLIAFATSAGATASDGAGANGLYTEHLTREMKISQRVEDVFIKTRVAVREVSGGKQNPQEWSQLVGQFMFSSSDKVATQKPQIGEIESTIPVGTIELTTEISGQLYLDGELLTRVNANTKIPINSVHAGEHSLAIVGEENWAQRVSIHPNEVTRINVRKLSQNMQEDSRLKNPSTSDKDDKPTRKETKEAAAIKESSWIWGFYFGAGLNAKLYPKGTIGVDFLYLTSEKFGVGAFASFQSMRSTTLGINLLIGKHQAKRVFFHGTGVNFNSDRFFIVERIGTRSSQKKFYWFIELGVGNGGGGFIGSANFGWSF